jgi:hypothetical protein
MEAKKTPTPYDAPAVVTRVEGGATAWVRIAGSDTETPVKLTVDAKTGDAVQVRVGGGSAWLTGNQTAPPTDDTKADKAMEQANKASGVATNYVTDTKDGIFVHPKNNDADGVRITDTIEILKGGLSFFRAWVENGLAKVRVGKADAGHTIIDSNGMRVYGGDGTEQLANIGYGETNADGQTETAPYYDMGIRSGAIGSYSTVEGVHNKATGVASHASGIYSEAGNRSFVHGEALKAGDDQTAFGICNAVGDWLFAVGNGEPAYIDGPDGYELDEPNCERSNALELSRDGVLTVSGGYGGLVATEDVPLTVSFAAGTIGTRAASLSAGSIVKSGYTYIGAYVADHRNTSYFSATIAHNGPNNTAHLVVNRATGNAVTDAEVTVRKVWLKTGGA